jgi:hypothetical protein
MSVHLKATAVHKGGKGIAGVIVLQECQCTPDPYTRIRERGGNPGTVRDEPHPVICYF